MYRWNNDYHHGAHPAILAALAAANDTAYSGYGLDPWCERAAEAIRACLMDDTTGSVADAPAARADIHFLSGGTQANLIVIAAALRPYQGVLCADQGHIHVHETGAVERTGHKILALPGVDGKLTAEAIADAAEAYRTSAIPEHITEPKLVFLSFPSELGTIYSRRELEAIRAVCDRYDLLLYLDGARLGYGLGSPRCDLTLAQLAALADAFTIGGTKCGALFGEAVVLCRDELKPHFRSYLKQHGAMLAKGWLLGLQFATLFQGGLYFDITRRADEQALALKATFAAQGIPFFVESFTNQQFVLLTESQMAHLSGRHLFDDEQTLPDGRHCVRFCTSWSTTPTALAALQDDIAAL